MVRFNRNYFLSACTILDSGRFNSCSLRSLIIRNFINLTKYFTKGAFTEILNEQKDILALMNQKYTEKEKIDKANNILENCIHEPISFRKMDLALIFFHGGDNSNYFSIITNKSPNDKTYIDLMKLKNLHSGEDIAKRIKAATSKETEKEKKGKVKEKGENEEEIKIYEKIEKLNDYMNYTQEQFLEELKDILDVKNPVKNEINKENKKDDKKDKTQAKASPEARNQIKDKQNLITDENKKDDKNDNIKLKNTLDGKNQIKNENKNEIIKENKKNDENDKIQLINKSEENNKIKNENKNKIIEENKKDDKEDKKLSLTEITKDYVFTADNFIKMCLILIRLRANIPVIMMGETGCGKTSLIRKLSELQNNGKCVLVIDNIHAGHTNEDIISFIEKKVIPQANQLAESQKEKKLDYKKNDFIYEEKKLWVFFDELNTCKSMDLLSEIICKHSCQGKALPENIVFIGAVNPYRKAKQKRAGLKISNISDTYDENDLVYTVNPMPHSLLNFVFDFGSLNPDDEKKYIQNMVKTVIFDLKLSELATELIAKSQNFIREKNGVSSVSLREIRRFIIFYKFFLNYLKIRKEIIIEEKIDEKNNDIKYSEFTDFDIKLYSINLSIYLGYYLRLDDNENQDDENFTINNDNKNEGGLRKILYEKINEIFKKESKYDFLIIPEREENFIADNVELEKGIAKNRALLENLFSLFVAINTKIPIFIVGKPGCSKSLSVQLINNAMKGSISTNSFFKRYPKMYVSTYQGALNSTSEGVKEIFEKAREILKVKENKARISTIYFDEMGLAEHSPHNPLKVIHSELEYDLNKDEKKVSFLGVSNWILDASKMNRGITITIPDPNENDIKKTSITIAKSYLGENLDDNIKKFFENLGSSYYEYKQEFKKKKILKKYLDFHGNRDFYHMIKYPSIKIKEALNNNKIIDNKILANLAIKGLERNFGGLNIDENKYTSGLNLIFDKLSQYNNEVKNIKNEKDKNYIINIKENVMNNLIEHSNDYLSRYLLLITRSNIGIYLITSFLKSINVKNNDYNNYIILIGSLFIDDIEKEEYTTKVLSKVKMNIEKDTILVLKDFESIYSSLYDLFNQNFIKVRGKKYARIALGSKTNSFSEVNNNFRCIIIVDEHKIVNQEIPFLNRFEKQSVSFEYLMNPEQIYIANNIYKKFQSLSEYDETQFKLINYHIKNLIINFNEEEILGITYMETQGKNKFNENDYKNIEDKFISKIGLTLPQDIILILLIKKKEKKENNENKEFNDKLLEFYNKNIHNNIKSFLSHYEKESNKIVIYTFTRIIDSIKKEYLSSYNIKSLGKINYNNIKKIRISDIENEINLESEIETFLENKDLKIFIIKLLPEYSVIDYLKAIIENKETEYINKNHLKINKLFIFLVHCKRVPKEIIENPIYSLSTLAEYSQIFIDDINGQDYFDNSGNIITLDKLLNMEDIDLYKSFINLKTIFLEHINSSLCYFDYSFNLDKSKLNKDIYINDLIELFIKDDLLVNKIDELILKNIKSKNSDKNNKKTLLEKMISEEKFSRGDICIYDILKKILNKNYINEFKIIYIELENIYFFSSILNNEKKYITNNGSNEIEFNNKIKEYFIKNININNKIPENEIKLDITIGYNLPSKKLLEEINYYIRNNIVNQYKEIEEDFKNKYFEKEEFEDGKKQYEKSIELLNNYTLENLLKNNLIIDIKVNFDKGEKKDFSDLLVEDNLLSFIEKNFKELSIQSTLKVKEFLGIILKNKFDDIKYNSLNLDFQKISLELNWIESYSIEIITIINFYLFLHSFENNNELNKTVENKISEINIDYENLSIDNNIKIINRIFYIIIGSLIRTLISKLNVIISKIKEKNDLNQLIDNLNNIYYSLLSVNNNLNLSCKEIYLLHEIIKSIEKLSLNNNEQEIENDKKTIIDFIQKKIINKEKIEKNIKIENPKLKNLNNEEKEKEEEEEQETEEEKQLKINLRNFYNVYEQKNDINFNESFSSILFDEFHKEYNENYRKYILKIILDNNDLIQHNILIIKIIISEYLKPKEECINAALDYISSEETFFPIINKYKDEIIEKNIIKIFDCIINLYLDSLENLSNYLKSDLLHIFKEYIKVIDDETYEKYYNNYYNENLIKLYILCFIKIYLNRFSSIISKQKNTFQGEENIIIEEIAKDSKDLKDSKDSSISNTIKLYFIILLYHNDNSLSILEENLFETIKKFWNELGENKRKEILQNSIIPKENNPYNQYFNYINYPSINDFIHKFKIIKENEEKYPLLNIYIKNDSNPKNLKDLIDYNDFINSMINYYSGKISRNDANNGDRSLNSEEIYKDENFRKKFEKFNSIWKKYLSKSIKESETIISDKFKDEFTGNERLAYFLNDNDDKGYGIFISKGLQKYIEWQNSFLTPIINAYKTKKNNILNCYISKMEKKVNVQDANNSQILKIENCFDNTYFINFYELIYLYCDRKKNDLNDFEYNFIKIEEELGKSLLPNKCLFNEKNIKYIIYQNEGFRYINYDLFINFGKSYGEEKLTDDERKKLFNYINKEYNNNNFDTIYDSFILLVYYLNNQFYAEKESTIIDFINKAKKKYINFSSQFITFFKDDGKDIVIKKLLNSILYMEHLCYDSLIEKIDIKFNESLDYGQKEEIKNYFNNNHNDSVITKKEISSAVRRFIIRYLLDDNKKENINPNLKLYISLERKFLWNNEIFRKVGDNFNDLIKKYLGNFSFALEVKHSIEFYNLIGEEEKKFISEEKNKFAGGKIKEPGNIVPPPNPGKKPSPFGRPGKVIVPGGRLKGNK